MGTDPYFLRVRISFESFRMRFFTKSWKISNSVLSSRLISCFSRCDRLVSFKASKLCEASKVSTNSKPLMQSFESKCVRSSLERAIAFVEVKLETDVIESDLENGVRGLDCRVVPLLPPMADLLRRANDALDNVDVPSTKSVSPAGS